MMLTAKTKLAVKPASVNKPEPKVSMTIREELDALWEEDEEIERLKGHVSELKNDIGVLKRLVYGLMNKSEGRPYGLLNGLPNG
jgi:hypothetical protein